MRKTVQLIAMAALLVAASFGVASATDSLLHVVTFDGTALFVSNYNQEPERPYESYEVALAVYDAGFEGQVSLEGAGWVALVVEDGIVTSMLTGSDDVQVTLPPTSENTTLVVGYGRGAWFLQQYVIEGDDISIVEKVRTTPEPLPTKIVAGNGQSYDISAFNRYRDAMELIIYTSDFGTHSFTNVYGAEATVLDGVVVAVRPYSDPNISEVPEGGYVVSGHNAAGFWIVENLTLGQTVELR